MTDDNIPSPRLWVATIGPPHGVKGQVKLYPHVDDVSLLNTHKIFTGLVGDATVSIKLGSATDKGIITTISGVTDRTAAEEWKGRKLYMERDALPPLDPDTHYAADLVGARVIDEHGLVVGNVARVDNFGASDLLDITPMDDSASFYIPFIPDIVTKVSPAERVIQVKDIGAYRLIDKKL